MNSNVLRIRTYTCQIQLRIIILSQIISTSSLGTVSLSRHNYCGKASKLRLHSMAGLTSAKVEDYYNYHFLHTINQTYFNYIVLPVLLTTLFPPTQSQLFPGLQLHLVNVLLDSQIADLRFRAISCACSYDYSSI